MKSTHINDGVNQKKDSSRNYDRRMLLHAGPGVISEALIVSRAYFFFSK
jgi:hypothetical protein